MTNQEIEEMAGTIVAGTCLDCRLKTIPGVIKAKVSFGVHHTMDFAFGVNIDVRTKTQKYHYQHCFSLTELRFARDMKSVISLEMYRAFRDFEEASRR